MALDKDQCVRLPPDWPAILVERTLLGQILRNLIGNGLKFNRSPQKMVEINWQEAPTAGMKITVRDNGIGIEPRFFEQIFGIFQRLHTRSEFEGTGIGLAIVRKAAQQLHGSVHIESAPGAGSCFTLVLPRHISTLQEASHEPA
jgi:light-regulated signal transduction histidine kinase (bacteriophytochrome)